MSSRPALPTAEEIGTLVPIGRIAKDTPYSADFLRQLARSGKLRAYKLNRDWMTTPAAVHDYLKSQTKRHEKALSLLQAAEKAFLALCLVLIVFSATPQARAQGLNNPPPSATSVVLHDLTAGWQHFLLSFGQALLGKTTEEYLADAPAHSTLVARAFYHATTLAASEASPQVLGLSISAVPATAPSLQNQIQTQIDQTLQGYLAAGKFTGPAGPAGSQGPSGLTAGYSGPNGSVQNPNGQTTSVIGGTPIVSYLPATSNGSYSGGSLAGFTTLSSNSFSGGTANLSGNLTVQGSASFTSGGFSGALTAGASTLSSLTVSGSSTFTGSTTIAGLTVSGLNPGLTVGSVAFQDGGGLAQDNANFFYDSSNHRLGLGTATPSQLLTVAGSTLTTGTSTLATTTITNLTVSQAPTFSIFGTGLLHSNGSGVVSSSPVSLGSSDVTGILAVSNGGSGAGTLSQYNLLAGNGSSALSTITPGSVFQVLRSAGAAAYPLFSDISSLLTAGSNITLSGTSTLAVSASPSFTTLTVAATSTLAWVTATTLTTTGNALVSGVLGVGAAAGGGTLFKVTDNVNGTLRLSIPTSFTTDFGTNSTNFNLGFQSSDGGAFTTNLQLINGGSSVVSGPTNGTALRVSDNSNATMRFSFPSAGLAAITTTDGQSLSFGNQSSDNGAITEYMRVTSVGLVGINSTTPSTQLAVKGSGTTDPFDVSSSSNASLLRVTSAGNVGIGTSTPTLGPLTMGSGAYVSAGGTWTNASDRNLKENFATLTPADILQKIDQLPVTQWDYKTEGPSVSHIGPVAQDFWDAFHLGNSSTSISTIDPAGVALLGIQALDQKLQALQGSFTGNATTSNGTPLSVTSPSNFSGDSVGEAKILTGQTSVRIAFGQTYQHQPIVTLTPEDQTASGEFVTDRNSAGFTIRTPFPVTSDTNFAWHSFASPAEQLTVSDGSTAPIPLIVPTASQPARPPVTLSVMSDPTASTTPPDSSGSSTPTSVSATSTPPVVLGVSTTIPLVTPTPASPPEQPDSTPATTPSLAPTPSPVTHASRPHPGDERGNLPP